MQKKVPGLGTLVLTMVLSPIPLLLSASTPISRGQPDCTSGVPSPAQLALQTAPDDWRSVFALDGCGQTITFRDSAGQAISAAPRVLAQAFAPGIVSLKITSPEAASSVEACLPAAQAEHFYGLGERFGNLDLAGQVVENWTADKALDGRQPTSYSPAPFLLSSRGYGLLLNTTARATFDLRVETLGGYCIRVEEDHLDLYLIAGPHPQTVIVRHAQLVGLPPLPPKWAFGVWKNLIGGQVRVEQEVQRLHAHDVPVDAIWIYDAVDERANFGWWWPVYRPIRPGEYPDLPGLIRHLHGQDLKVLGYLNPFVYPGSASFTEASQRGYLIQTPDGKPYVEPWTFTPRGYVDFTNPEATKWWQARVHYALTQMGFDGAMLDFGGDAPLDARYANGQPGALAHNEYSTLYNRAAYLVGQSAKLNDFVFFARSGYSGSQAYATGRFTGDQVRSWDPQKGLPSVIPAMLSGGLSGWPYWGPDIGGFFENGPVPANEPAGVRAQRLRAEKELWIRWVQLGALSPTMRDMLGWQSDPVGLWTDEETLTVFRAYARLHTALKPYLYHYAQIAHEQGLPILRPLFLNYPSESAAYSLNDEYLLGDDVLVAPVLQPGQAERHVYVPTGRWRDYWSGDIYVGPGPVIVPAPLHHIPLFVREGATLILPALEETMRATKP